MEGGGTLDAAVRHVTSHPDFAGRFKHPVKFNGSEFVETKLTEEEQLREVTKLASGSLHVFLERYGNMLPMGDVQALRKLPDANAAEVQFWVERLLREPLEGSRRDKQRRRRRWVWARREMARPDGFFCEDEMKRRDPKMFHRLVGRHLDSALKLSAPMQGSLSGYLMQQLERECEAERTGAGGGLPSGAGGAGGSSAGAGAGARGGGGGDGGGAGAAQEGEDGDDEDFFGDEDDVSSGSSGEDGGGKRRRLLDGALPDDAAVRWARFLKAMRDRFVVGREPGYDYAAMDEDSELDDVVELGRDAEDKYFDDD
mmetsp:Transcript_153180/g.491222  ORF Transcript_153180/g.491222 Transcript_153180/m.491222 type:complete len:313 (+) Transcript_153180:63-1001(+)